MQISLVFPGSKPLSRMEGGVRATTSPAYLSTHHSGCSRLWLGQGPCSVPEVLWPPAPSPTGYAHAQTARWVGLGPGCPWDLSY